MQTSDLLNSPLVSQNLIEQDQRCSPGIDQLIQKAEFENAEQVRLIETEKQRYAALVKQLEDKTHGIEELEKSTNQLDDEAKQLHRQFKQNRDICESLKRTNDVLQEHQETLQKKREMVRAKAHQVRLENQTTFGKYQTTWERYRGLYESRECAKESAKVRNDAMENQEKLTKTITMIQQLESGIWCMEKEKKNIEDSIQKGITSAIPVITELAQLSLQTRSSAESVQQITAKITSSKEEQQKLEESKYAKENTQVTTAPGEGTRMVCEPHPASLRVVCDPETVHKEQTLQRTVSDKDQLPVAFPDTPTATPLQQTELLSEQMHPRQPSIVTQGDPEKQMETETFMDKEVLKPQQHTLPPATLFSQGSTKQPLFQQDINLRETQTYEALNTREGHEESNLQPTTASNNMMADNGHYHVAVTAGQLATDNSSAINSPTTPVTPGTHSHHHGMSSCSEASNSPFDLDMHTSMVKQLTTSPGDGFLFRSRPMFDSSKDMEQGQPSDNSHFSFNLQESQNGPGPTESGGDFFSAGQNSMLFGPPSNTKDNNTGIFGANLSPFSDCSIFGQSNTNQQQNKSPQFSFSFGVKSPHVGGENQERSAPFSLF